MVGVTDANPQIVGRDVELAALNSFLDEVEAGTRAILIEGSAGIGKTTLWSAVVAEAAARSWRVLISRPGEAETRLSFSGLADLLEPHLNEAIDALPAPQRKAIEVALLRAVADQPVDTRSVQAAALSVLRALAASGPLLVAVDDVQWLDVPTLRVLQYVARRLTEYPVAIAVSHRAGVGPEDPLELARALPAGPVHRLVVGPMTARDIGQIIRARLDITVPPAQLRRLHAATGGNPFFALEITRGLADRGMSLVAGETLTLPESLKEVLTQRLARLPRNARLALVAVASSGRPSKDQVVAASDDGGTGLERAIRAGIVEVTDGQIRFAHPLLAAAAYEKASEVDRRRMHRRLAEVVSEHEERARHLALAVDRPDEAIAAELQQAAEQAHDRGAPDAGAELAELAMRLTPPDRPEDRGYRAWLAARYHAPAGDLDRALTLLREAVATMQPGPARAEAMGLLRTLPATGNDRLGDPRLVEQALEDAKEDPQMTAHLRVSLAARHFHRTERGLGECLRRAEEALAVAERLDDPLFLANSLYAVARYSFLLGHGIRADLMERGLALAQQHHFTVMYWDARDWADLRHRAGDLDFARQAYSAMQQDALDTGYESFVVHFLAMRSLVESTAANWTLARELASKAIELIPGNAQGADLPETVLIRAVAEAHLGLLDTARAGAEQALAVAVRDSDWLFQTICEELMGFIEVSLGRYAEADAILWPAAERIERAGIREPALFRFIPDEIEALVGLGDLQRAKSLLEPFEDRAQALDRVWARAEAGRCRALLLAALGDFEGGLAAIDASLVQYRRQSWPFELGRMFLAQGEIHRRARHKRLARGSLRSALEIFERLGATIWAEQARSELGRISGRAAGGLALTETEQRVAELVASGLRNKEIANALFISVSTVESTVSSIYRKLGIRSRAELAARMAGKAAEPVASPASQPSS